MFKGPARVLSHYGFGGLITSSYYAVKSRLARMVGKKYLERRVYDYKMRLDPADKGLSRTLLLFGKRELDHKQMLARCVTPGMTVLDIGANIGYYAIMEALLVGPEGRIVAIEPADGNINLLKQNLELNQLNNVEVIQGAVSDASGEREIFTSSMSNLHTFHPDGSAAKHLDLEPLTVNTFTLGEVISRYGHPDVMRMDVEGHEVEILGQIKDIVSAEEPAPRVIFETHLSRYTPAHDFIPVLEGLFNFGYSVVVASSSSQSGTDRVRGMGYSGSAPFQTDLMERALFDDIKNDDAIELICRTGGLRTVLIEKRN